jgi:hypothetical protein
MEFRLQPVEQRRLAWERVPAKLADESFGRLKAGLGDRELCSDF